jgi:penicillin-binding protein 2
VARFRHRVVLIALAFALAFGGLVGRLAWLQLRDGGRYARKARDARLRVRLVRAPRGRVLDARGRVLAADLPAYRVALRLAELERGSEVPARVARIIRRPRRELEERWQALRETARVETDGPPLGLATAPSKTSRRLFQRLAEGEPGVSVRGDALLVERRLLGRRERVLGELAATLGASSARFERLAGRELARALAIDNRLDRGQALETPLPVATGVDFDTVARLEERAEELPGVVVEVVARRRYPWDDALAHVIGYTGALGPDEVRALRADGRLLVGHRSWKSLERFLAIRGHARFLDGRIGRAGVEASFEELLAGVSGGRLVERDRRTGAYRVVSAEEPIPGRDLHLTIDAELQRATEAILDRAIGRAGGRGGAAVLLDAETGAVRVLASAPRYPLAELRTRYAELAADPGAPLVHRALAAQLPPGSTVKPLVTLAALSVEGLEVGGATVGPDRAFLCRGYLHTRSAFQCNARSGHGPLDLAGALERSCNIPYYRIGEALQAEGLAWWYRRFGLGGPTGIELPGERDGLVPTRRWKQRRLRQAERRHDEAKARLAAALSHDGAGTRDAHGARAGTTRWWGTQGALIRRVGRIAEAGAALRRAEGSLAIWREEGTWRKGDSRNVAIGQGNMLATPLQLAVMAAALANGGRIVRPRIARETLVAAPSPIRGQALRADALSVVREGMKRVTDGAYGTARASVLRKGDPDIPEGAVAVWRGAHAKSGTAQAGQTSHAWIVGWLDRAGVGDAPLAFCVVVEGVEAGGGGSVAGPVAARMLHLAVMRASDG